jgi:hypothetical protein
MNNYKILISHFSLIIFACFLFQSVIYGQNSVEINGTVMDSATGKPLEFAQISVQHSRLGTTTNEDGNFRLSVPSSCLEDTLFIFYLGYASQMVPIRSLINSPVEISMRPVMLQLKEVDVIGLTPEEVIRRAVAAIPSNYGKDPLILTAFIRSQKSVNNKLAEFTEAIIRDFKTGYYLYKPGEAGKKHQDSNVSSLMKGRVTSDTNLVNAMGDVGRNVGCLGCNFTNDLVEFYHHSVLDSTNFRQYNLSMEEIIQPGTGKIYHIRYDQKKEVKEKLWKGDLYIDGSSFAVMRISQKPSMYAFDAYEKKKYDRGFMILNKPGWVEEMPFIQQTITYAKRDTSWFLNSIRTEDWMTFTYPPNGQRLKFSYKNEVIITDATRNPESIKNFKGDKLTGTSQRWDQIIGRPDEAFWAKFNYLPVEEKLKSDVEAMKLVK